MSPPSKKQVSDRRVVELPGRIRRFLAHEVWEIDLGGVPTFRALGYRAARVLYLAIRGLLRNECLNQASALTYITVLSLVPMLALAFSVAKGFGAYDHLVDRVIQPYMDQVLGPVPDRVAEAEQARETAAAVEEANGAGTATAGEDEGGASARDEDEVPPAQRAAQAEEAENLFAVEVRSLVDRVLGWVNQTNFSNLGLLGLGFVLFTVIKLLTSVENVMNRIWGVKKPRSITRKITDYVALVVITPILLITATAFTGAAQSNRFVAYLSEDLRLGWLLTLLFRLLPLIAIWLGFAFLYLALPNTRVKLMSALVGGMIGGTLWLVIQVLHVKFQIGVARWNAIYAGFAAIPIFLAWVYIGWVTVLLGAQLAWAHQSEPAYRELMRDVPTSTAGRENVAVHAMLWVARAFVQGERIESATSLGARLAVPPHVITDSLAPLIDRGLIAQTDGGNGYVPVRDLSRIRIHTILDAVRGTTANGAAFDDEVERLLKELHDDLEQSPRNLSLRELAEGGG